MNTQSRANPANGGPSGSICNRFKMKSRPEIRKTEQDVRAELAQLHARYDSGAISPTVFSVIRALEVELAWIEHTSPHDK